MNPHVPEAENKPDDLEFDLATLESLKSKSVKAFKWSAFAEISSRAIQPIITLVLARILAPADFGVVAIATMIVSFCQLFQDFGLGKTIIQMEKNHEEYANIAFWLNLISACSLYVLILVTSPWLGDLFGSPECALVLRVLCLQLVLSGLSTVHAALFQRRVRFNLVFIVRLVSAVIPGLISIPLALSGYGVWSLVAGTLAGSFVQFLLYWWLSDWRPRFSFDFRLAKDLLRFSKWVAGEGLAGWFISWGDSFILGSFLGVAELGQYRLGAFFVIFLSHVFFTPFVPIAYSFFSRLQDNRAEFRKYFLQLSKVITAIVLPVGGAVALLAEPVTQVLLGEKWEGTEIVIATMSLRWALGCLVGLNSTGYTSIGRPDVNLKVLSVIVFFTLPIYFIAAPYGLAVFCIARLGAALIDNVLNFVVGLKVFKLKAVYVWNNIKVTLGALTVMSLSVIVITQSVPINNVITLLLTTIVAISAYLLTLWILQKDFLRWSFRYALQMVR
jgi:O-antigen/teichoic acid export membrane protein